MVHKTIDFRSLLDYGIGVDSPSLSPRGKAVTFDPPQPVAHAGGQQVTFHLHTIQSNEDFENAFSIDASVKAQYGLFGASAKFSYGESLHFTSEKKYAITEVNVVNAEEMIDNIRLLPHASDLLSRGKFNEFRQECGDMFVKSISTGGCYYGVVVMSSENTNKLQDIYGKFTANYGLMVSGDVQVRSQMKDQLSQVEVEVTSFQLGGTDTSQPIDFLTVVDKAKDFATQVKDAGVPFTASIIDYNSISLPNRPNSIDIENSKIVLEQYYQDRSKILESINTIKFIKQHPDYFEDFDRNNLEEWLTKLTTAFNETRKNASKCVDNIGECELIPVDIPINDIDLPKRKPSSPPDPDTTIHVIPSKYRFITPSTPLTLYR